MKKNMNIALIAHDNKKEDLLLVVNRHKNIFAKCNLFATGTTGALIKDGTGLEVNTFNSGPLGGDLQIGAMIVEHKIDMLIFLWDPLEPQPHDVDVKALLRIAVLYNIPTASNLSTTEHMLHSIFEEEMLDEFLAEYL